jgi:hypothetical protein
MSDTFVESDNSFCDKQIIQQRKKRRRIACKKYNRKRSKKLSLRKNEESDSSEYNEYIRETIVKKSSQLEAVQDKPLELIECPE